MRHADQPTPKDRAGWKGLTNKNGRPYGSHAKGHGVKKSRGK